jgi:hypothetical protein
MRDEVILRLLIEAIPPAEVGHSWMRWVKSKGKDVPVLLTEHHAMMAYWGMEL